MKQVSILPGFWAERRAMNARQAIFHQWQQLEASGCIENFRIAAGEVEGWREGWFFADSDAYKWLEAAVRIQASGPDERLERLIDDFTALLGRAQSPDGYLFTYNQIHFPQARWQNLQIEHELYCHGHLIEAGVSHYELTGRTDLLAIARKAADRILADFRGKGPEHTPGHEEIEIALLRLYEVTKERAYMQMAEQFLEQRGRTRLFALSIVRQNQQVARRGKIVRQKKEQYLAEHPGYRPFQLPPGNAAKKPANAARRWYLSALSGKYFQQHAPIRRQTVPVGHSVRFAYLKTAEAMLARQTGDRSLLETLETVWERMVERRMYVTGGIGAAPGLEGFGSDYELDPQYAYAETCAALACMFWNWQMAGLTGKARYSDLFEWQLYNASGVGMGADGSSYFYNNPLACEGGVERRAWFAVPCCPSNLSRTWADLERYIYASEPGAVTMHQYISSQAEIVVPSGGGEGRLTLRMESQLPWQGKVRIQVLAADGAASPPAQLRLRLPSWCEGMTARVNGEAVSLLPDEPGGAAPAAASGYDPRASRFVLLPEACAPGNTIEIELPMPVVLRRADPRVRGHQGKAAVTRGPLVYCLESVDHPGVDIFSARLDPGTITPVFEADLLGGVTVLKARAVDGSPLVLIPYYAWGNRGPSQMTVWVNANA